MNKKQARTKILDLLERKGGELKAPGRLLLHIQINIAEGGNGTNTSQSDAMRSLLTKVLEELEAEGVVRIWRSGNVLNGVTRTKKVITKRTTRQAPKPEPVTATPPENTQPNIPVTGGLALVVSDEALDISGLEIIEELVVKIESANQAREEAERKLAAAERDLNVALDTASEAESQCNLTKEQLHTAEHRAEDLQAALDLANENLRGAREEIIRQRAEISALKSRSDLDSLSSRVAKILIKD